MSNDPEEDRKLMTTPAHESGTLDKDFFLKDFFLVALDSYRIEGIAEVMTPALAIYPEIVDANIQVALRLLGGEADRWRPHVKTAKLGCVMRRMVEMGIRNFKCSTTLELATIIEAGAEDALLAYPVVGANARRVREIAERFPETKVSALVETAEQIEVWSGSRICLFIDVNPGMDRTGIEQERIDEIVRLAASIESAGLGFGGLHYYDGHLSKYALPEREAVAHRGYDQLMKIVSAVEGAGINIREVITAGTPAFPCSISYRAFSEAQFTHRASPGTIVYCDCTSLAQLPAEWGFRPAAVVVSTVVSRPSSNRFTVDAGHKTVSADAGVPTCAILGRPNFIPQKPSEEHLPVEAPAGSALPSIGEAVYLVPRHICPTVNNFDHALLVSEGRITGVERVTARGREAPFKWEDTVPG
ncbi:MAG: alanine racemase [Blastocatellia bacterium]|nr:alanine racemase [Blastocatellia bacterium]